MNSVQNQAERKKRVTRKRGYPDDGAKLVALKAEDLLEDDKFECHICKSIFCREQNLVLHLRSHEDVPSRKMTRAPYRRNMAFICPVIDCIHHDPARALSDISAIKRHYCRKHGEKKWKCSFCPKTYAVDADRKQHEKSHKNTDNHHEYPRSSRGKEACESHKGAVFVCEDNLDASTRNGECESINPPLTFLNNSSTLKINEQPQYYAFDLPLVNQPPLFAPMVAANSLLNINEPPPEYNPKFQAEQNHANTSALVHNHHVAQLVAAEQSYANMLAPIRHHEVVLGMQINSSNTSLSKFELDFLASNSTIRFTDMLHYGMPGSLVDGATSRGTMLHPNSVSSYQTVPGVSLSNLEHQRNDLNIISLGLNSQGFVIPPEQQGISDTNFSPRQGMYEMSFYKYIGNLGD